jgi:subtilisin-like proprotein convertase family protein
LTIVGNFNQFGTNFVQVVAQDSLGLRATNYFQLGLSFVNHAPTIDSIPRQVTRAGAVLGPVPFTIHDVDTLTNTISQVTIRANSDNQKLIPDADIQLQITNLDTVQQTLSGTMTMYIQAILSQSANVTLTANDTAATTTSTFNVFADVPGVPVFSFPTAVTVNANGPATPYPSINTVSGLSGLVEKVTVTLFNVSLQTPQNARFLLVDPNTNHTVLLMAGVGGNNSTVPSPVTLVFDDTSTNLPQNGQIISGIFQPTQFGTIPPPGLPSPAPASPYGTTLGVFTNINPNGDWKLWVADGGSSTGGSIVGGWHLNIQTTPSIPKIKDQTTDENVTGKVPITVGDSQPGVNLQVGASGDPSLFQAITVSGSGAARTLSVPPQAYTWGTNVAFTIDLTKPITVFAYDPITQRGSTNTFNMAVRAVAQPPLFVSKPGDQTVPAASQLGPLSFKVWPPQGAALSVTASSLDNPALIPYVQVDPDPANSLNGTNAYKLTLIPAAVLTGTATVTIVASDTAGTGLKSLASFRVTVVVDSVPPFNSGPISIPAGPQGGGLQQGEATPYPSTVSVKGPGGVVSSVKVALVGLTHSHPEDLDILLVSPDSSKSVMLMAHAGFSGGASGLRLTFDDTAAVAIPQNSPLSSQFYKPADYSGGLTLPSPAPARPYATTLTSAFAGINPNGDWQLFVIDDNWPFGGTIDNGWVLYLETAPAIAPIPDVTTPENVPVALPLTISDATTDPTNLVVTVSTSGDSPAGLVPPGVIPAANISVTGTGANLTLNLTNALNQPSAYNILHGLTNNPATNLVTVTVTDPIKNYATTTSFGFKVLYANQSPTISTVQPTNTVYTDELGDSPTQRPTTNHVQFTVGDVDSTTYLSNIVATFGDQSLIANSNISLSLNGSTNGSASIGPGTGTLTVHFGPAKYAYGTNQLSVVATDGSTLTTNILNVAVIHVWQIPSISSIADQRVHPGSSTWNIPFTVGSVEVNPMDLVVYASSDNPNLVPNTTANILLGGTGNSRTIQLSTIGWGPGTAHITVFVTDNSGQANSTNSTTFFLNAGFWDPAWTGPTAITTSGAGKANVYPSVINVSGLSGSTFRVTVKLPVFTHNAPANLDVLLSERDADGKTNAVMLMSGAGDGTAVSGLSLTFDDSGAVLPTGALTSGIYQPANYTKGPILPAPAPTNGVWFPTLGTAFAGHNPNGIWELFVNDRATGDSGNIAAGWQLFIQTAPTITGVPATLSMPENGTNSFNFTIGDTSTDVSNLVVQVTTDNSVLLPARNVSVVAQGAPFNPGPGGYQNQNYKATIAPTPLQDGTVKAIFTVLRTLDSANSSATNSLTVTPVNVAPVFSRVAPVSMQGNTTTNIQFTITDPDTPQVNLVVWVYSTNQILLPNSGLSFGIPSNPNTDTNLILGLPPVNGSPDTSLLTLNITPASFQVGTTFISIVAIDTNSIGNNFVTNTFQLSVFLDFYEQLRVLTKLQPQQVAAGGTVSQDFAVASATAPATSLQVTGKSDNQSLVKDANINVTLKNGDSSGTNRTVTVIAESGAAARGTANITLTLKDPANNATVTAQYAVTVRPSRVWYFTNSSFINILDISAANPYPSSITVSGLAGPISKVTATLTNFSHTFPSDVGVLLVGPTGQKIVLMNNAGNGGGGVIASNLTLTFDQSASLAIPQSSGLTSGTFRPADYSNGARSFLNPAPAAPYTNTLNGFTNTNPNGTWNLFVQDFESGDVGGITNGWSLGITTLPVISGLADITVPQNTNASQAFTVLDDTESTPIYTFTGSSDNQSVVTNGGIVFSGSGANWVVNVNPVANTFGSAKITVTMQNGDGQTVSTAFKATFNHVTYPPFINPIADQSIPAGSGLSIPISYGNPGLPNSSLTLGFQSSDTNLVPVSNIKVVGNQLFAAPVGVQTGKSVITVSVTNPSSQTTNTSFTLNVVPPPTSAAVFANSGSIAINDNAAATPYPSTINVSGLIGRISSVTASVKGLGHGFPQDISLLLVGPQGQTVVLMSRAGGSALMTNTMITFDDTSTNLLPQFTLIPDGTYRPTDYKVSDTYFPPAPIAPYGKALSVFNGTNPNGNWSLFVQDDQAGDKGVITGGWVLSIIATGHLMPGIGPQTTPENTDLTVGFTVSSSVTAASNLVVTASNSGDSPAGLVGKLTLGGTGSARTLLISPTANLPSSVTNIDGTSSITVSVSDGTLTNSETFPLTVTYVNQPPTITGLSDQSTPVNVPVTVNFTVGDVDSPVSNLVVTASGIPALGNIAVGGSGSTRSLTFTPTGATGATVVGVLVTDDHANTLSNGFVMTLTSGLPPVVSAIPSQTIPKSLTNTTVRCSFTVHSGGTILSTNLQLAASSDNTSLVPVVSVTGDGTNFTATAAVAALATGTANISVFARDEYGLTANGFVVTVTPFNYPPTLGPIADQTTAANIPLVLPLNVSDPDTSITNLTFYGTTTNAALIHDISIAFNGIAPIATLNLVTNQSGDATITLFVSDGVSTNFTSFLLHVTPMRPKLSVNLQNGQLRFTLTGASFARYGLQTSADLQNWTETGLLFTTDATGTATITMPPPARPYTFARAHLQ